MKYVLRWTWNKTRQVKTQDRAKRAMGAWKRWYERQGWEVFGAQGKQMIAIHPDGTQHAILMYDLRPARRDKAADAPAASDVRVHPEPGPAL